MNRLKLSALKKTFDQELADEYGANVLFTPCHILRQGDTFFADYAHPDGFCDEAWKAIYQYVFRWLMVQAKSCSIMAIGLEN